MVQSYNRLKIALELMPKVTWQGRAGPAGLVQAGPAFPSWKNSF
jgi:hypothetical protein